MNFLGHLYLSGDEDEIKIGNFIGDFVKGNPMDHYQGKIAQGIIIHREIDSYTDSHPVCQRSRKRLVPKYRHYSGVIIDIFYDHFLATNWSTFSSISLEDFAEQSYEIMQSNRDILPEGARHMLPYMRRYNWLLNYSHLEGIEKTLGGMSRRTSFESKMDEAVEELKEHYELFQEEFLEFFPEIRRHIEEYRIA